MFGEIKKLSALADAEYKCGTGFGHFKPFTRLGGQVPVASILTSQCPHVRGYEGGLTQRWWRSVRYSFGRSLPFTFFTPSRLTVAIT